MLVLVCYDVNTETKEGRRRLRRVAKVCKNHGQRVQKSVFECRLEAMQFEELERALLGEIDEARDCLRLYRLPEGGHLIKEYGQFKAIDFDAPLVL
jgi:CRISPR-associated protein Cas2